jgi:hypothetical protein
MSIKSATTPTLTMPPPSNKLYRGPAWTTVPGVANIYYAPKEFISSSKALAKAEAINDRPGIIENGLRTLSTPFSFLNSLGSIAWYVVQGGIYVKLLSETLTTTLFPLSTTVTGLGIFMSLIEGGIETYGLARTLNFNSDYLKGTDTEKKLEKIWNNFLTVSPEFKQKVEDYVRNKYTPNKRQAKKDEIINEALDRKFNQLVRHVYPRMAEELKEKLPGIFQELKDQNPFARNLALGKAKKLLKNVAAQSGKEILVHIVGMAAVAVTLIGLILSCLGCPFFIPFIFLLGGATLSLVRYFLHEGLMNTKGWEFSMKNCVPMSNCHQPVARKPLDPVAYGIKV